jgi:hypothetical protein
MSVTTVDNETLDALREVVLAVLYWYHECENPDVGDEQVMAEYAFKAAKMMQASGLNPIPEWVVKILTHDRLEA